MFNNLFFNRNILLKCFNVYKVQFWSHCRTTDPSYPFDHNMIVQFTYKRSVAKKEPIAWIFVIFSCFAQECIVFSSHHEFDRYSDWDQRTVHLREKHEDNLDFPLPPCSTQWIHTTGCPKKTESNFKFRLFKDDLIVWSDAYCILKLVHFSF